MLLYSGNMNIRIVRLLFGGAVFAGMVRLISTGAEGQNLFEADSESGNIYESTPGGVKGTFASGLGMPAGLAFDNKGDLFVANSGTGNMYGNIYEYTPSGVKSTIASGLVPTGLAFNSAGDLFVGIS